MPRLQFVSLLTLAALALLLLTSAQDPSDPSDPQLPSKPKAPGWRNLLDPTLTLPTEPDEYSGILRLRRSIHTPPNHGRFSAFNKSKTPTAPKPSNHGRFSAFNKSKTPTAPKPPNHETPIKYPKPPNDPHSDSSHACTGVSILEHWALFSAHCIQHPEENSFGNSSSTHKPISSRGGSDHLIKPPPRAPDDDDEKHIFWHEFPSETIELGAASYDDFQLDTVGEVLETTPRQVGFRKQLDELSFYDLALVRVSDGFRRKRFTVVARREDRVETGQAVMTHWKDGKIQKTPVYIVEQEYCRVKEMNAMMYVCGCLNDTSLQVNLNDGPLYWHYEDPEHLEYVQRDSLIGFIIRVMRREDGAGFVACEGKPAVLFSRVDRWIRWIEAKTQRSLAATRWRPDAGPAHIPVKHEWLRIALRWLVALLMIVLIVFAVILGGSVV